jgi:transcriptional regulator with XRE-family HTH domain
MRTALQAAADRRAAARRRDLADSLQRLLDDAGITRRELASVAGVARAYVGRILDSEANPSLETYARLSAALGADLSTRIYPNSGPVVRDRWAAPMIEHVLGTRHPRWSPFLEVGVHRPVRGWIDIVLHDPREDALVAGELQSELRRLEQQIRWHAAKADALPSWAGYDQLGGEPRRSGLLVVRRTRATRAVAAEFGRQLRAAYPAHPDDALAALTGTQPWPGSALVWMTVEGAHARWVSGR